MQDTKAPTCEFQYGDERVEFVLPSAEDHISKHILQTGSFYELQLLEALAHALAPDDLVVDAGANIGNHTVFFAKVLGCRVLAFEPVPTTCAVLRENVRRNGLSARVEVFQTALGAAAGTARIAAYDAGNIGGTTLGLDPAGDIEVQCLDAIPRDGKVRLLKIDVEGMDLAVLAGAETLLENDRPWIVCEAKGTREYGEIADFLAAFDYVATACFNATDTYVFLPSRSDAERDDLVRHGFGEIIQLQRDTRVLSDRIAQLGRYAERLVRETVQKVEHGGAEVAARHAEELKRLQEEITALQVAHEAVIAGKMARGGRSAERMLSEVAKRFELDGAALVAQHSDELRRLREELTQLHNQHEAALVQKIAQAGRYAERLVTEAGIKVDEADAALAAAMQRVEEDTRERISALDKGVGEKMLQATEANQSMKDELLGQFGRQATLLERILEETQQSRQALAAEIADLSRERMQLVTQLAEANTRYQVIEGKLPDLQLEVRERGTRLQAATATLTARERELSEMKTRMAALVQQQQRAETDLAALRVRAASEVAERDRWQRLAANAAIAHKNSEDLLDLVSHSVTYQLGSAFLLATRSPRDIVKLPVRLFRLLGEMRKRRRAVAASGVMERRTVVPIQIPAAVPSAELHAVLAANAAGAFPAQPMPVVTAPPAGRAKDADLAVPRLPDLPGEAGLLRLAVVMDEFTYSSYAPCCDVLQLSPSTWREQLEAFVPDMLFIESAWQGKEGAWQRKIANGSDELDGILAWCRQRRIPTVFWNKEDPVHFETFVGVAQRFDYVFTTDIDCIGRYKAGLGHDRVFLLPFACQPRSHNPIEKYDRKDAFCFAGAYYPRYPERQKDFDVFIDALTLRAPVEIFDRNHGKDNPDFMFPERYRDLIQGNLPFDQIDLAYKGYRYAINLNSVKQSQTMFARRAFDLLGCNTLTVSNYSRGLRLMFGDLVIATDSGKELLRRLESLLGEANTSRYRRFRLAGLRKVLAEHTYQDRLSYVLSKVSGRACRKPGPKIVVVAQVGSDTDFAAVLASYDRQCHADKRLALVVEEGFLPALPPGRRDIALYGAHEAAAVEPATAWDGCFVAAFSPEDYYGPNYLVDLALARTYSDAGAIGKAAYYRVEGGALLLVNDGSQYREQADLPLRCALLDAGTIGGTLHAFALAIAQGNATTPSLLAIDEFNYVRDGGDGPWPEADDMLELDPGLPIAAIQAEAEAIPPALSKLPDGVLVQGANALAALFAVPRAQRGVRLEAAGDGIRIVSALPADKHEYVYSILTLPLDGWTHDGNVQFHMEVQPGVSLELALIFLDVGGERVGSVVKHPGRNLTTPVPDRATQVRLGLRIKGCGEAVVKRFVQGHLPSQLSLQLGRFPHLLLTNQYPSYEHIYRNGFVHRRVLGYRQEGMHVDVFCLRKGGAAAYHEYEDVDVTVGWQEQLRAQLASNPYQTILVHFLDEAMWAVLREVIDYTRVIVWVHGSEIQPWYRRDFNYRDEAEREHAKVLSDARMAFWREVLKHPHPNLHMVFVSRYFAEEVMEDVGIRLLPGQYSIIHNFIDTELFDYQAKPVEQRLKVLSIRPYASRKYANDLSVEAVLQLKRQPFFEQMEFRFIGDGPLFDETLAPLAGLPNVAIERRFLSQGEIARLHKDYGLFLCPTRMDSQGVSRDEAMASGLVPVTNAVTAIPEFVDEACGLLAPGEDAESMAAGMALVAVDPDLFAKLSTAAAERTRRQCGYDATLRMEHDLIMRGASAPTLSV